MDATVTVDSGGRILIPKSVRDELHLAPGDKLEMTSEGEQFVLRPIRTSSPMRKKQGIWVFRTGHPISAATTDKALQDTREQRDREIFEP